MELDYWLVIPQQL